MGRLPLVILAATLVVGCSRRLPGPQTPPQAQPLSPETQQQAQPLRMATQQQARTPEEVVRAFFVAMFSNDEVGVRKEMLPNPNPEILWQGEPLPPEFLRWAKPHLQNMTCRECKVGEIIDLPGAPSLEVTDQMVNERSRLVFPIIGDEPSPIPLFVFLVDGAWKVDAAPLIAARQAATRMKEKETSNQ